MNKMVFHILLLLLPAAGMAAGAGEGEQASPVKFKGFGGEDKAITVPAGVAKEVRFCFRRCPELLQGGAVIFDDVILAVGNARQAGQGIQAWREKARYDGRIRLLRLTDGFLTEDLQAGSETLTVKGDQVRLAGYSMRQVRTMVSGRQKEVVYFGEWQEGDTMYSVAGLVYGTLSTPREAARLPGFQCDEPWRETVLYSRPLHTGGVLPVVDNDDRLYLLVAASASASMNPVHLRDRMIRSRALSSAIAYAKGLDINSKRVVATRLLESNASGEEPVLDYQCDVKKFSYAVSSGVAAMSKAGSWLSADGKEEFQLFYLKISDIR